MESKGFTLIEILVVIVIIAILAAIAIPSLLETTKSANQVNAAESLRSIAASAQLFKQNHSSSKYWVGDIYGLYDIKPNPEKSGGLQVIDATLANADGAPLPHLESGYNTNKGVDFVKFDSTLSPPSTPQHKSGYLFRVLQEYDISGEGPSEWSRYDTQLDAVTYLNSNRFGYLAYPSQYGSAGRFVFKMETATAGKVYKRDPGQDINFKTPSTYTRWEKDPMRATTPWSKVE